MYIYIAPFSFADKLPNVGRDLAFSRQTCAVFPSSKGSQDSSSVVSGDWLIPVIGFISVIVSRPF